MDDKMEYIIRESGVLTRENLEKLGSIVYDNGNEMTIKFITESPDGVRILLDDLPSDIIDAMYNFVKNQLELEYKQQK